MKKWLVYTPNYEVYPALPFGDCPEPGEWGADCVEVEAETKHDAIVCGLRLIRQQACHYFNHWDEECNPMAVLKAEQYEDDA